MRTAASRNDSDYFTFIFHADSVPRGGGPRGGGPRPLPPGPRGGGPRLWESTSVREVRLSTTIPGNFDFYTVLCGGAPRGGGPRGGGPLGGGPRGGGPRGGPPMVFYARGCPLVPSGCIRSENGPRPATLLQRPYQVVQAATMPGCGVRAEKLSSQRPSPAPSWALAAARKPANEAYHSSLLGCSHRWVGARQEPRETRGRQKCLCQSI